MRISKCKPNPELDQLLRLAAAMTPTPRERWLQRVSFVYGQLMDCAPNITREEVERRAVEIYGPCPD